MHPAFRILVVTAFAVLLRSPVLAGLNITIADDLILGGNGYFADALSLSVAPTARLSVDLNGGLANRAPGATDYAQSWGLGVSAELAPRVSVSGGLSRYRGEKGVVMDPVTMGTVGTIGDRQVLETLYCGIKGKVLETTQDEEDDRTSVSVSMGWAGGKLVLPVDLVVPVIAPDQTPISGEYTVRDTAFSGGISFGMPGTTVAASYARHHYRGRYESADSRWDGMSTRPGFSPIAGRLRMSVAGVLKGLPDYESVLSLSDRLPEGFSVFTAYGYTKMETDHSIARTYTSEIAWMAGSWIELRAGSCWVRQYQETTRFTTAGLSLFF